MIRVVIIGAGNVAIQLARAIDSSPGVELVQHYSRNERNQAYFPSSAPGTKDLKSLQPADIYIVAISDDAIEEISAELRHLKGLVVHTSGSIPVEALSGCSRYGVLYPVQTFSKDRAVDWSGIPLALETHRPEDMPVLRSLASALSRSIHEISSPRRKKLHLAAVFANNFSNHMYTLSKQVCQENQLPFELMKPLIQETAVKVMSMEPEDAQTGPARRDDRKVMEQQEAQLSDRKKEIYALLSQSIARQYGVSGTD